MTQGPVEAMEKCHRGRNVSLPFPTPLSLRSLPCSFLFLSYYFLHSPEWLLALSPEYCSYGQQHRT